MLRQTDATRSRHLELTIQIVVPRVTHSQWRRNEFESGGGMCRVPPLFWLCKYN